MNTTTWLDRTLLIGPHLCLCTTQDEYRAALDECGIEREAAYPWGMCTKDARTQSFAERGKFIVLVTIEAVPREGIVIAGLLVHEAVHVFQMWCDHVGEKHPSTELEAYAIQWIAQQLMWAYSTRKQEAA